MPELLKAAARTVRSRTMDSALWQAYRPSRPVLVGPRERLSTKLLYRPLLPVKCRAIVVSCSLVQDRSHPVRGRSDV